MSDGNGQAVGVGRYETARRFLDALFGQVEEQRGLLVWTVRQGVKRSYWPGSVEAAAKFAAGADEHTNVYVGCGWRHAALGPYVRGDRAQIAGISALWIDMDVVGAGHSAKAYPPSFEDARALVAALPLPPSIVVNSGGGLHLWWRFREPWAFEDETARAAAGELVQRWEATVHQYAAERSWVLDSVHDLPRVLRIPGTWRSKPDEPQPRFVDIESDNNAVYSPSDFEPFLVSEVYGRGRQANAPTIEVGAVVLRPDAEPPQLKLSALCAVEPRFRASWFHKRTDLKDDSESGYDLAVANYAAQADWTDQEIADLIIARRRTANADVAKALRLDYIRDRITHARVSVTAARVRSEAKVQRDIRTVELEQTLTEMDATVERGGGSTEILAYLSDMLGVEVVRWTQATRHQAYYELHIAGPLVIAIGEVRSVTEQKRFSNAVYAHTGRLVGPFKADDWARIVRALGAIVEVSDVGSSSRIGQLCEWLDLYKGDKVVDLAEYDFETLRRTKPFRKDGRLYVHAGDFLKWLVIRQQSKIQKSELLATMKLVGFESAQPKARDESGKLVGRHYWQITEDLLSDALLASSGGNCGIAETTQEAIPSK